MSLWKSRESKSRSLNNCNYDAERSSSSRSHCSCVSPHCRDRRRCGIFQENNHAHKSQYGDYAGRTGFSTCRGLTTTPSYSLTLTCSGPAEKQRLQHKSSTEENHKSLSQSHRHEGQHKFVSRQNATNQTHESGHAWSLRSRARSAVGLGAAAEKRETERRIHRRVLGGASCSDS